MSRSIKYLVVLLVVVISQAALEFLNPGSSTSRMDVIFGAANALTLALMWEWLWI